MGHTFTRQAERRRLMPSVTVNVIGMPIPQGSMVSNGFKRGMRHSNGEVLMPWRAQVAKQVLDALPQEWDRMAPVSLSAVFRFPRPQSHYGTGRNAGSLRSSAPGEHIVKPDLDKALRAINDSLEAGGIVKGDQQVCSINATKRYCIEDEPPGVLITLINLKGDPP